MANVVNISFDVYPYEVLDQLEDDDIIDYVNEHKLFEIKRPTTSITEKQLTEFLYLWMKASHNVLATLSADDMKQKVNEIIDDNWYLFKKD